MSLDKNTHHQIGLASGKASNHKNLPDLNLWNDKSFNKPKYINIIGNFQSEDAGNCRASVRCRSNHIVNQCVQHVESNFVDWKVYDVNVGILRSRSGDIV